jgi:hypothetical protein
MSVLLSICIIFALAVLIYNNIIHPKLFSPLSKVPNAHFTAPFSSLWIKFQRRGGRTGIKPIFEAHESHGPVVRIGPSEVSVASLDGLRQVYIGAFEKTGFYLEFMNFKIPNLVSMMGNQRHSVQKRMISNVYSKSFIQSSTDLESLSKVLLFERLRPILERAAISNEPVDVIRLNGALGSDFMISYLLGIDSCQDFVQQPASAKEFLQTVKIKTRLLPGHEKATQKIENLVLSLCEQVNSSPLEERESNPVVYAQLSSRLSQTKSPYSNTQQTASEMMDHLLAGTETVRVVPTYLQWELSRRPALQAALRHELQLLPADYRTELPDPKALDALPLLNALLKETMRCYPATSMILPRITPPQGTVIDGYTIPGGVTIGASAYCLHNNPEVFQEPEKFDPYRWFDEKRVAEMNRWWWAFASGGRMCIGSHFAIFGTF